MKGLGFDTVKQGLRLILKNQKIVPNIVGHAGIGKTQLTQSLAKEEGYFFRGMTCSLLQEGDLAMPVVDTSGSSDSKMARVKYVLHTALVEIIEYHQENPDGKSILFLDEFNRASSPVQSELMNLVLQREVMGTELPEGCRIILAENPASDVEGFEDADYHVNERDNAINDRTMRIRMDANLDSWLKTYASKVINDEGRTQIHTAVQDFLHDGNINYFLDTTSDTDKKPTPRAWERVSEFLYTLEDQGFEFGHDDTLAFTVEGIKGSVGDEVGRLFTEYLINRVDYIRPEEIINANKDEFQVILERLNKMQELRKVRVTDDLVRVMSLRTNSELIKDESVIQRLVDVLFTLDVDALHAQMDFIAETPDNDFVSYKNLWTELTKNPEYSKREFDIMVSSNRLINGIENI